MIRSRLVGSEGSSLRSASSILWLVQLFLREEPAPTADARLAGAIPPSARLGDVRARWLIGRATTSSIP